MGPDFCRHDGRKSAVDCGAAGCHALALTRSEVVQYLATEAIALQFESERMTALDTFAAISTPLGEGAIALVRISGANAIQVADKIFRGKEQPSEFASHVQHLGELFGAENQLIDQVVLSVHRAPASYTGEDLVEISCHGGTLVSARVLEACLRAGARAARPGEFP